MKPNLSEKSQLRRRILLVDDRVDKRDALYNRFRSDGYSVVCAEERESALTILETGNQFSVMLMDLSLPNQEDGLQLIREARKLYPTLTTIVYTGRELKHGLDAVSAGASFFIEFRTAEELVGIVNAVATKNEIEQQLQVHKLRGAELQGIFNAVGVELLVRDIHGEVTMINKRKSEAWVERGQAIPGQNFIGTVASPDGQWTPPQNPSIVREQRIGAHTLLIQSQPIFDEQATEIGWVEATWDISRRTRLLEFIQDIEQKAYNLSKQDIADRVARFLANFTGGRVRFYLFNGHDYRGYASANMSPTFDFKAYKLSDKDPQRENAFIDHSVKIVKITTNDICYVELDMQGATEKLFIPLFRRHPDIRLGVIVIDNKLDPQRAFTQEDVDLIALFRSFIEVAIKGAIFREEREQEREWLEALNSVEEELALTDDVKGVYSKVLAIIQEKTRARSAVLKEVLPNGSLKFLEYRGGPQPTQELLFTPPIGSIAHKCIKNATIVMVSEGLADDPGMRAFLNISSQEFKDYHKHTKAVVMLPLLTGGKVTGLCVLHFSEERALSDLDQSYGHKLLNFVSLAMIRMKQIERIRRDAIKMVAEADLSLASASLVHSMRGDIQAGFNLVLLLQESVARGNSVKDRVASLAIILDRMSNRLETIREWIVGSKHSQNPQMLRRDILEPLLQVNDAQIRQQTVVIVRDYPDKDVQIQNGPAKLRLSLLDFLQNSLRMMLDGGTLALGYEIVGNNVTIFLADTGPGWPEEIQRAFEAGNMAETEAPIGLGLYLGVTMLEGLGAKLRAVKSRLDGKGAEIQIQIEFTTVML